MNFKELLAPQLPYPAYDKDMEDVLIAMLEKGETITFRSVMRAYPKLKHASALTRNPNRRKVVEIVQTFQQKLVNWSPRVQKQSKASIVGDLAKKDLEIKRLRRQNELLIHSHIGLFRAVGSRGGYSEWTRFFNDYQAIQQELADMGAIPSATINDIRDRQP